MHGTGTRIGGARRRAGLAVAAGLLALAGLAPCPAVAQSDAPSAAAEAVSPGAPSGNPYVQRGVPAEATAENGVLAREKALAAGRRTAWNRLVAEAGGGSASLSDGQIEGMVRSIVIEEERVSPGRYTGRITVNFNQGRVRSVLGERAPSSGIPAAAPSGEARADSTASPPPSNLPASTWLDAVATYRSMAEWLELRRRLRGAGPVASVEVQGISTDRARLRLGLRAPGPVAAGDLAALGIALQPAIQPGSMTYAPGEIWRVGLAGGG